MTPDARRPLEAQEWLDRYRRRFEEVAHLTHEQSAACAECETFAVLAEGYEDDPEGAADMEMSYWND